MGWKLLGAVLGAVLLAGAVGTVLTGLIVFTHLAEPHVPRGFAGMVGGLAVIAIIGAICGWRTASEEMKPRKARR